MSSVYFYNEGPADVLIHVFQTDREESDSERTYLPMRAGVQYAVSNQFRMFSRVNVDVANLTLLPAYVYWAPDMEPRNVHALVKAYPVQGIDIRPFLANTIRTEDSWATRKPLFNYRTLQQFPPQRQEPNFTPAPAQTPGTQTFMMTPALYVYRGNTSRAQAHVAQVAARLVGKRVDQADMLKLVSLNALGTTQYQKCFFRQSGNWYMAGDLLALRNQHIFVVVDASSAVGVFQGAAGYVRLTDEIFGGIDAIYRISS